MRKVFPSAPGQSESRRSFRRSPSIRPNLILTASSLIAGAAALAVIGAPVGIESFNTIPAPTQQFCNNTGMGVTCSSPGDNEINDAPTAPGFYPYGGEAFLLGNGNGGYNSGGGGGGGFGGFHGGGFGGGHAGFHGGGHEGGHGGGGHGHR